MKTVKKKYMKNKELAEVTGLHPGTLRRYRRQGLIPYLKVGPRSYLYDPLKVIKALEKRGG